MYTVVVVTCRYRTDINNYFIGWENNTYFTVLAGLGGILASLGDLRPVP